MNERVSYTVHYFDLQAKHRHISVSESVFNVNHAVSVVPEVPDPSPSSHALEMLATSARSQHGQGKHNSCQPGGAEENVLPVCLVITRPIFFRILTYDWGRAIKYLMWVQNMTMFRFVAVMACALPCYIRPCYKKTEFDELSGPFSCMHKEPIILTPKVREIFNEDINSPWRRGYSQVVIWVVSMTFALARSSENIYGAGEPGLL